MNSLFCMRIKLLGNICFLSLFKRSSMPSQSRQDFHIVVSRETLSPESSWQLIQKKRKKMFDNNLEERCVFSQNFCWDLLRLWYRGFWYVHNHRLSIKQERPWPFFWFNFSSTVVVTGTKLAISCCASDIVFQQTNGNKDKKYQLKKVLALACFCRNMMNKKLSIQQLVRWKDMIWAAWCCDRRRSLIVGRWMSCKWPRVNIHQIKHQSVNYSNGQQKSMPTDRQERCKQLIAHFLNSGCSPPIAGPLTVNSWTRNPPFVQDRPRSVQLRFLHGAKQGKIPATWLFYPKGVVEVV